MTDYHLVDSAGQTVTAEEAAWRMFSIAHPVSAYRQDKERFLSFAMAKTGTTREAIERAIVDVCAEFPDDPEVRADR